MAAVLDKPQINLANVKTSITSIVEAQLDKINTMESSREIFLFIRNLFDKHNIDTKKSRDIIQNLATMRNVENARAYIYNFCLKGEGQGTLEIDKKPRYKNKMFKIDEKLKKIVSEDIEKIEVETTSEEITVETDGDAVKVEVEPKAAECADCRIPVESTADLDDYAFFSDLNPETDIDDIPADAEPDGTENVEESLFKESAQGTYSMRMYDYIDEYLDNEGRKDLCYAFTKWLSDDEVHEFAKANDLVPVFEDEDDLYEGIEKKYVKPLKDKINACYTKQDLDEIGAYLDDFSDKDIDRILSGKVSNKDVNKMFGGYNFVDDDFPGWDFKESKSIKESYSYSRIYEYIDSILGDCCRGERRWPKADPNDFARILEDEYNLESEEDYSWKDLCRIIHDIYPNGEYAGDELDESKSIKESNDINPDIWKAIGRHFDYIIAEKAAEILENLADRALMQDNVEDTYEAVTRAIDDGLFNSADIWEINALYDECVLSDNAYSCLIEDLVQIVDTVRTGDLNEGLNLTESTEKQYLAIDTQDKGNKDNNRKYTEKQLIDFAKELIKIEEESSEPDQYKKRPELKDDLASAKKVLKYFMYDVKEAE